MSIQADIDIRPRKPVNKMVALAEEYRAMRIQAATDVQGGTPWVTASQDLIKVGDDLMVAVLNAHERLALFKQVRTYPIEVWRARKDQRFLDGEKQHVQRVLAFDVMEKGYLPVEVPQYREIFLESRFSFGGLDNTDDWREVPEPYADTVQIEYSSLARPAD